MQVTPSKGDHVQLLSIKRFDRLCALEIQHESFASLDLLNECIGICILAKFAKD